MINDVCLRILHLCTVIPNVIHEISSEELELRRGTGKWSKKEILGHLIDSAANNHQRFVRAQAEVEPVISYDQNEWVKVQHYQHGDIKLLINLWEFYNRHIVYVISNITNENLLKTCRLKSGESQTLLFLIQDYLKHLEHHLKEVVSVPEGGSLQSQPQL